MLKEGLSEIFADQMLLKKLNLNFIITGMMWIADNWSTNWNKEMMQKIIDNELPNSEQELSESYFGKVLMYTNL